MRKAFTLILAAGALGAAVAGCGSSRAAGVQTAPSSGPTSDSVTASSSQTTTTSSTSSAAADITPKSGPLSREPTISTPKGAAPKQLETKNLITGSGTAAADGDTITVNYVGALYKNGKVFDSSWSRKETFTTPLSTGSVISGWVKGIAGEKVGGRRELIIPPADGYGSTASGPIPANSTLIFDVDLLKVTK